MTFSGTNVALAFFHIHKSEPEGPFCATINRDSPFKVDIASLLFVWATATC